MYADDNRDKINGVGRVLRAIASAPTLDPEDLVDVFARLRADLDNAERMAVANLREQGHSWASIAAATGLTRQALHKRYGSAAALATA